MSQLKIIADEYETLISSRGVALRRHEYVTIKEIDNRISFMFKFLEQNKIDGLVKFIESKKPVPMFGNQESYSLD